MNKALFTEWIKDHLCPTLSVGQYVILDNAVMHKGSEVDEAIQKAGVDFDISFPMKNMLLTNTKLQVSASLK